MAMAGRKVIFAVSRRSDGPMGLMDRSDERIALKSRARFFRRYDIPPANVVRCDQVHGVRVGTVRRKQRTLLPRTDALITDQVNTFLAILAADCFPVFFFDRALTAVGVAHAGWRGVVGGIVPTVARAFQRAYKVRAVDLQVVIGPGIRACHYEVWLNTRHAGLLRRHPELARRFIRRRGKRAFLNLPAAIRWQLIRAGVSTQQIRDTRECTFELRRRYFSYRRERTPSRLRGDGNMIAFIGIRELHAQKPAR